MLTRSETEIGEIMTIAGPMRAVWIPVALYPEDPRDISRGLFMLKHGLSLKELRQLECLAQGREDTQVMDDMKETTLKTVKNRNTSIFRKLHVHNRTEASRKAQQEGLFVLPEQAKD